MMHVNPQYYRRLSATLLFVSIGWMGGGRNLSATDYFLTIGGGYDRSGNQASLEANVVFFQQTLADKHRGARRHDIFFADGDDPAADLQVVAEKRDQSAMPATDLLSALHRRRGGENFSYRNHRVGATAGPLVPALIRANLDAVAKTAGSGDRLIIYVTAHGSAGPKDDPFNTTIDCWNGRKVTARGFTDWLNKLPPELPVVLVMAQCYCGGFGHVIFEGFDESKGLAPQLRVGFFAQQHDLPAAGCRPDIEHDEEFSSYFWGALAGHSRNGVRIDGCDIDGNGVISFGEAYAYAVIAGETIDIPLRTSEVFLRTFSRLSADKAKDSSGDLKSEPEDINPSGHESRSNPAVVNMSCQLETLIAKSSPVSRRIVTQLCKALGLSLQDEVTAVMSASEESRRASRSQNRGRSRQGSGRRELLREVTEKWPELGDERKWADSSLLKSDNQDPLISELKQLASWKIYEERRQQMQVANIEAGQREIRTVKYRRLINALESIVLEQNLPLFASPQLVERYQQLLSLEESTLNPGEGRR
jgi:hypothetical protein